MDSARKIRFVTSNEKSMKQECLIIYSQVVFNALYTSIEANGDDNRLRAIAKASEGTNFSTQTHREWLKLESISGKKFNMNRKWYWREKQSKPGKSDEPVFVDHKCLYLDAMSRFSRCYSVSSREKYYFGVLFLNQLFINWMNTWPRTLWEMKEKFERGFRKLTNGFHHRSIGMIFSNEKWILNRRTITWIIQSNQCIQFQFIDWNIITTKDILDHHKWLTTFTLPIDHLLALQKNLLNHMLLDHSPTIHFWFYYNYDESKRAIVRSEWSPRDMCLT